MSQLHERLEQLINYSSQLIFVSSDSLANQQKTLGDFLASQNQDTEVSFFSAQEAQSASDYRRTICRQLANHTVGTFARPLKELLYDLDAEQAQYLVCISNAQAISMSFLEELWDWVANARIKNEALHLNLILFADHAWTEQAQKWLPEHQSNKPVILSSQSVDAVGFDVSALEQLMAQKRAFFASESAHSIVRKKWFISIVLVVFLGVFTTLMYWQYPQHVDHFLDSGEFSATQNTYDNDPDTDKLDTDNQPPTEQDAEPDTFVSSPSPVEAEKIEGYVSPLELVQESLTSQILVSNWPQEEQEAFKQEPISEDSPAPVSPKAETDPQKTITTELESEIDSGELASNEEVDSQDLIQTLYNYDGDELLRLDPNSFVIQLSGIQNLEVLNTYLQANQAQSDYWVYQTQRYGGPWYVVIYKQSFDSLALANAAIANLSETRRTAGAFAKTVSQIQAEIRAGDE